MSVLPALAAPFFDNHSGLAAVNFRRQDQFANSFGRVRLHRGSDMCVDVCGYPLAGVVEAVLNDLHRYAGFEGDGCPAVTNCC